ncbi:hypothetical protein [Lysobacter antibioticus]|uniref:hypothetical protein n=1 Tax=Lysobacter antibioticus TaxID=84531 RepID=UPI00113FD2B7|nr:hypothetical protein [Lysobacter antibioticus]
MPKVKTSAIWLAAAMCIATAAGTGCRRELRLRPETLPAAAAQAAYAASICVANPGNPIAAFEIESGELPEGLRLEHARGEDCARIEGKPARPGRYRFAIAATEFGTMRSGRSGRVAYVLDVAPVPGRPQSEAARAP